MSPTTFYNHLSDRNWTWWGLKRLRPAPDRNYPWVALVVFPVLTAAIVLLPVLLLARSVDLHPAFFVMAGVWGFTVSLVHRLFAALSWNQRAARLRRSGESWVPVRPGVLVRWLVGPVYMLLIAGLTPLVLLSAVENFRGAWRWRTVRTQLMAAGERLDIALIAPPAVPAEQNFFAVAPFGQLIQPGSSQGGIDADAMAEFRVLGLPFKERPDRDRGDRRPLSAEEWAATFRAAISNQVNQANSNRGTPSVVYRAAPEGASASTVILTAMADADPLVQTFCEASRRPYAVFPVQWSEGFNALLPHLANLKTLQLLLEVRVIAYLAAGQTERAFAETECSWRIAGLLRREPLLISQLVRFALLQLAAETAWQGIAAHAWNDSQLETLQAQFSVEDGLESLILALEGERAMSLEAFDRWTQNRTLFWASVPDLGGESGPTGSPRLPLGWIRQNQVSLAAFYQDLLTKVRRLAETPEEQWGDLNHYGTDNSVFTTRATPYNLLARMLAPALDKAVVKAVRSDVTMRSAATGCALERYRLKHGTYPESLTALVPEFLPRVPLDPGSRQPLQYRRTSDGLFRLWSVGSDGRDDGGQVKKSGAILVDLDWPWPYQME